jgi:methylase of polypeptide subunit release factors
MTSKYALFQFNNKVSKLTLSECSVLTSVQNKCKQFVIINEPVLMTDIQKTIDIKCKHSSEKCNASTEYVANNFYYNIDKRITTFDGITIVFDQKKFNNVFGPNIDTILFCYALKTMFIKHGNNYETFFEIGIGSGFISKYIHSKLPNIHGTLIDIEKQSIEFARNHLGFSGKWSTNKVPSVGTQYSQTMHTLIHGDVLKYIPLIISNKSCFDLVVCNPPYIPHHVENKSVDINDPHIAKNFFEGTYVMRYIINNIQLIVNKTLVLIISSTSFCIEHVQTSLETLHCKGWSLTILEHRRVPLKVYTENKTKYGTKRTFIHDNPKWKTFLTNGNNTKIRVQSQVFKKGAFQTNNDADYPLEHIVYIVAMHKN